jgi:hypothetical protein
MSSISYLFFFANIIDWLASRTGLYLCGGTHNAKAMGSFEYTQLQVLVKHTYNWEL